MKKIGKICLSRFSGTKLPFFGPNLVPEIFDKTLVGFQSGKAYFHQSKKKASAFIP
jgi:hypothetical protein